MISFDLFRWRAYKIIQRIPADQRAAFELKLLAGDYLKQRTSFIEKSINQEWKGDYLLLVSSHQMKINETYSFFSFSRRKMLIHLNIENR
jgi:hypothetical protein